MVVRDGRAGMVVLMDHKSVVFVSVFHLLGFRAARSINNSNASFKRDVQNKLRSFFKVNFYYLRGSCLLYI